MITPKDKPIFQEDTLIPSGKLEADLVKDPTSPTSSNLFTETENLTNQADEDLFANFPSSLESELFADEHNRVVDSESTQLPFLYKLVDRFFTNL